MPSAPRWITEIIEGRATRSRVINIKGEGRYIHVEVYPTSKIEGEPVGEWDMPVIPDYSSMAIMAVRQTDFTGHPDPEPEVNIRIIPLDAKRWMWQIYVGSPGHVIPYLVEHGTSHVDESDAKSAAESEVAAAVKKFKEGSLLTTTTYRYTRPEEAP